jgi:hypothetical protein
MAQDYDNNNRGSIWKNDKKETEKHPDFTGSLNVNGQEFWVSAWKRRPDQSDKAPALSFSIKAKDETVNTQRQDPKTNYQDDSDTIPF